MVLEKNGMTDAMNDALGIVQERKFWAVSRDGFLRNIVEERIE